MLFGQVRLHREATRRVSKASTVTFGVAGTLGLVWGALGFFGSISTAVNYAWGVEKNRSYWKHKLFSFLMLLVAGVLLIVALLLVSARQSVVERQSWFAGVVERLPGLHGAARRSPIRSANDAAVHSRRRPRVLLRPQREGPCSAT